MSYLSQLPSEVLQMSLFTLLPFKDRMTVTAAFPRLAAQVDASFKSTKIVFHSSLFDGLDAKAQSDAFRYMMDNGAKLFQLSSSQPCYETWLAKKSIHATLVELNIESDSPSPQHLRHFAKLRSLRRLKLKVMRGLEPANLPLERLSKLSLYLGHDCRWVAEMWMEAMPEMPCLRVLGLAGVSAPIVIVPWTRFPGLQEFNMATSSDLRVIHNVELPLVQRLQISHVKDLEELLRDLGPAILLGLKQLRLGLFGIMTRLVDSTRFPECLKRLECLELCVQGNRPYSAKMDGICAFNGMKGLLYGLPHLTSLSLDFGAPEYWVNSESILQDFFCWACAAPLPRLRNLAFFAKHPLPPSLPHSSRPSSHKLPSQAVIYECVFRLLSQAEREPRLRLCVRIPRLLSEGLVGQLNACAPPRLGGLCTWEWS